MQESVYIFKSEKDSSELRDLFCKHIEKNDRIFVAKIYESAWSNLINTPKDLS